MKRLPWLTALVFAVTAAFTAAQFFLPDLIPALRRQPSMLTGEPWRFVTAWLVHDDGWGQIAFNFTALAAAGTMVELWLGWRLWVIAYLASGLAGEIAGVFWQPVGAGNSVAVLGLAALLAAHLAADTTRPPPRFGFALALAAVAIWLTAARDIHGPALLAGFAAGVATLLYRRRA